MSERSGSASSETTERMCSAGGRRLPMRFVELHDAAMKAFHAQLERRGPTSEQAELAYLHAIADLWDEVTALRAALAAATAREEASKNMEQHATAVLDDWDGHARRLVVWCYNNPRRLNLTGSPTNWPNESEAEYVARALAAAKGGQDG